MAQTLNEQPQVTFEAVNASVFFDYGELLDWFYKPFPAGTVQSNHVFWVESSTPTVMFTKETAEEPTITLNFCNDKFVRRESRIQQLREFSLKPVAAQGMKEIKQVELYTKWRKFVPAEFADEICPKPPDEVLENVQKARSDKNKERASKKQAKALCGRGDMGRGRGGRGRGRGGRGSS
jgi:hypothetical protein